jgi:lysosomal acid lipase/cholesteryl ester hydrolase
MWQSIICTILSVPLIIDPPIFVRMIDISCSILFGWTAQNIPFQQRVVSYAHLYSYTSVKTLVHWFQIIRAQTFQMFDDEASGSIFGNAGAFYKVAKFPTKNIHSPIALIYGGIDSLVEYVSHTSLLTK